MPALFAVFGALVVDGAVRLRQYLSPVPGYAVGGVVVVAAAMAARELWKATPRAPAAMLASGGVTIIALRLLFWVFPLVNASDEAPSIFAQMLYPGALAFSLLASSAAAWAAQKWTRRLTSAVETG